MKINTFTGLLALIGLTGCSSSSLHGFCSFGNVETDIESYKDTILTKKVVIDSSPLFASSLCEAFEKSGVECHYINDVVSPLKKITASEMRNILRENKYDVYFALESGNDSTLRSYGGSISTFQASSAGHQLNGTSQTTNITYTSRGLSATLTGYNILTQDKIYLAKTYTSGSGTACVGNGVYSISLANEIVKDYFEK